MVFHAYYKSTLLCSGKVVKNWDVGPYLTVYHYHMSSSYSKEMNARQQSSEQDEWARELKIPAEGGGWCGGR